MLQKYFLLILINFMFFTIIKGWDNDELEIFDLVEEINKNFYTVLNVPEDANATAIRKAFRALSLVLHPDKNDSPDADQQFRQLVSIYDVLKDPGKREHYDNVLRNGLPNWRSAVYYYRHYRKMGLIEMTTILVILISIGQYAVGWASYVEKKFTAEQLLESKLKKQQKKANKLGKTTITLEDIIEQIPVPRLTDTLPIQIPKLIWKTITGIPSAIRAVQTYIDEEKQRKEQIKKEVEDEKQRQIEEEEKQKRDKELRKRRKQMFVLPERTNSDISCILDPVEGPVTPVKIKLPLISGGLWTDDDLAELVHLVKKYPPGTSERWERIAEIMNRSVPEVTHIAAKMKENCYRLPEPVVETEISQQADPPKKVKTKGGKLNMEDKQDMAKDISWSQLQQKALENALAKYPKGATVDRWDKIAKCVPDKTKEECVLRYKYLVELVKKQKENSADNQEESINENYSS